MLKALVPPHNKRWLNRQMRSAGAVHDTPFTRTLYATADEHSYFGVQRHISCDGANRTKAAEVLAIYRSC